MNTHVENAIQNGYHFSIGNAIDGGFNIFKKDAGGFIGYALVAGIITIFVAVIPLINFFNIVLSPTLMAGFYIVANKIDKGEETNFNDFFKGFDRFGQMAGFGVLQFVLYIAMFIPVVILIFGMGFSTLSMSDLSDSENANALMGLGAGAIFMLFIVFFVYIFAAVSLMASLPLILFCGYDAFSAMKTSFRLITKNWLNWFGLALIGFVFYFLGIIFLFLGLIVAIPVVACINYTAFRNIVHLHNNKTLADEIEQIGN